MFNLGKELISPTSDGLLLQRVRAEVGLVAGGPEHPDPGVSDGGHQHPLQPPRRPAAQVLLQ